MARQGAARRSIYAVVQPNIYIYRVLLLWHSPSATSALLCVHVRLVGVVFLLRVVSLLADTEAQLPFISRLMPPGSESRVGPPMLREMFGRYFPFPILSLKHSLPLLITSQRRPTQLSTDKHNIQGCVENVPQYRLL